MKIKRSTLMRIVREELARHIGALVEADGDKEDKEDGSGKGGGSDPPAVADADSDGRSKESPSGSAPPVKPQSEPSNKSPSPSPPTQELPSDPADVELDGDAEEPEAEEPSDDGKSDISDEIVGKRIQSITMEPKSKIMPGAVEVNLTFSEVPDTFRILINKSGKVVFYWKGLHNEI